MKMVSKCILVSAVVLLAVLFSMIGGLPAVQGGSADHVRWDIVSLNPPPISPGGVAFAAAPDTLTIKLTGSGTFDAPASGGTSSSVTGGGTWETFSGTTSTGSGNYEVRELISWQLANLVTTPASDTDAFGDGTRANGNAVLRIVYDDGSEGVLSVGCRGSSPHPGIVEGVIATKDFVTYWNAHKPLPGVNTDHTLFHVR
ncbi:MAG TPA: hypothetical protein VFN26_04325 [Candidatus Acidoferrum sp.]|nr:hypothetical protein [Candidatus Acidoferrum sp.]